MPGPARELTVRQPRNCVEFPRRSNARSRTSRTSGAALATLFHKASTGGL